jgi:hypothetical protein
MAAIGLIFTSKLKAAPWHAPDVGVTLYAAIARLAVVLVRTSLIEVCPVPAVPPLNPVPVGTAQEKVVPAGMTGPMGV